MAAEEPLDVVGIGALNLDLIVDIRDIPATNVVGLRNAFAADRERPIDVDPFLDLARDIRASTSRIRPERGGSAFNTIHALSAMKLGLNLGYVGVDSPPPPELADILGCRPPSATSPFGPLGINSECVFSGRSPGGLSIALVDGIERSLRTHADRSIAGILRKNRPAVETYLGRARHLHITSMIGPGLVNLLVDIICAARGKNPGMTISVDPGELWTRLLSDRNHEGRALSKLLQLADWVFVNHEEFVTLGVTADIAGAARFFGRFRSTGRGRLLFLKGTTEATCFHEYGGQVLPDKSPQRILPSSRLADTTGAGDTFAAGVLAGLLSERGQMAGAMAVGLAASRKKIQYTGSDGYAALADVITTPDNNSGRKIFISHSFEDIDIAHRVVDLLQNAGVPRNRIFYSGLNSTGAKAGEPLDPTILHAMKGSNLVVMLVSLDFLKSEYCRYEVGASWALGIDQFPIRIPPTAFTDISPLLKSMKIVPLTAHETYAHLYDRLGSHRLIRPDADGAAAWSEGVERFVAAMSDLVSEGGDESAGD